MLNSIRTLGRLFLAVSLILGASAASAESDVDWPSRPIRLVVPFPPGGGTDVLARLLGDRMQTILGQTIVIDNRPGATGNVGNDVVAKSAPDGYTVLVQATIIGMFPLIFTKLNYDPLKDLMAVTCIAESANVVVVNSSSPVRNLQDLVKAANPKTGTELNYSTAGVGSPQHLAMEQLARAAGMHVQHITYRGTAPAINDLMGDQTQFGVFTLSAALPFIQGRKLRALAVMTARRSALLPDVPGMAESGFPGIDSSIRFALFVPVGIPPAIVARLEAASRRALAEPALRETFVKAGYEVVTSTPEQTAAMVRHEHDAWGPVVKDLGLRL